MDDQLLKLLQDYLGHEPEAIAVCQYAIQRVAINRMAGAALIANKEVISVPSSSLLLLNEYDNALINNSFFLKFYGVIKSHLALEDTIANTINTSLAFLDTHPDDVTSMQVIRTLVPMRYLTLIHIVGLVLGYKKAQEFSFQFFRLVSLLPEEQAYFAKCNKGG